MTLRLHQLSVVDTDEDDTDTELDNLDEMPTLSFRHARAPSDDVEVVQHEAPMAEDVAPVVQEAEIRPFHDPDDMVERFEARITGKDDPKPGPGHNGGPERLAPYSEPVADATQAATENGGPVRELDEAPARYVAQAEPETADDEAAFEAALSAAVAGEPADAQAAPETVAQDEGETKVVAATRSDEITPEEPKAGADAAEDVPSEGVDVAELLATAVIDEDVLRPIVAKLIRAELQGELGERITRNVRKLVRNEVLRVLAAKDVG